MLTALPCLCVVMCFIKWQAAFCQRSFSLLYAPPPLFMPRREELAIDPACAAADSVAQSVLSLLAVTLPYSPLPKFQGNRLFRVLHA